MTNIARFDLKRFIISVVIAAAYAAAIGLGNVLQYEQNANMLLLLFLAVAGAAVIYLGYGWLETVTEQRDFTQKQKWLWFGVTIALLLLMWLPSFIAAFPGVFSYDAPHQLWQFVSPNGKIINNQPIVSSLMLFAVMKLGYTLFGGTWEAGLTFYLVIQMGLFAATFAFILIRYILRKSYVIYTIVLLFFGLYPANQLLVVNAAKDVMYALFFLWFVIIFAEILKAIYQDKPVPAYQYALYGVVLLLLMFWRNNTMYAFVLTMPFMCLLIIKHRAILSTMLVSVIVLGVYLFVTIWVYGWMGFGSTSIIESLAVPEQQLAFTYIKEKDTLTPEQIEFIEKLMPEDFAQVYVSTNSDYIRPRLSGGYIKEIGFTTFVKQWAEIGLNHKNKYIKAFLNNTRGYWYPYHEFSRVGSDRYLEYDNSSYDQGIRIQRYMLGTEINDFYYNLADKYEIGKNPWINWLTSIAFTFWMTVIATGFAINQGRKELILVYLFIWLIWLTLFSGPLALMRYVYPFTITLPYLFFDKCEPKRPVGQL